MKLVPLIPALFVLGFVVCAMPASRQPAFEAADVHISQADATPSTGFLPGGRIEIRATTLLQLISAAWSVPVLRINGGPGWIDSDRFDILAKAPASAPKLAQLTMLQNL